MRAVAILALVLATACAPTVAVPPAPSPPATSTPTVPPAASASPSPSTSPIPLPNTAQVAAARNGVVWMFVADRLFASTDAGATWTERSVPPQLVITSIAFVDDTEGWILDAGSPATQCQAQGVTIWHTRDGARTWDRLVDVPGDGSREVAGIGVAQCKGSLSFVDSRRGYFVGTDPNSAPTIYRTSDGGKTWASDRLPDPPGFTSHAGGFTLRPGAVADFGPALFLSAVGNTGAKEATYVFRSSDAGASWRSAGTAPDLGPGAQIVFLTPTRWLAPFAPAPWAETTDGGATWHPFDTDYRQAAPIAPQIVFGDASTGYATVRGGLQRTTDGGLHWTALTTPGT